MRTSPPEGSGQKGEEQREERTQSLPSKSSCLALYQVSLCSEVRIPTGCSQVSGDVCRIASSCSTM